MRAKMQHKEFIILCLEDCSDWSNATTRRVVMQVSVFLSFYASPFYFFCVFRWTLLVRIMMPGHRKTK